MTEREKKVIEKLKETVKQCHNSEECWENEVCYNCYVEIEDILAIETALHLLETKNAEIEKKDKIIDEMAKTILEDTKRLKTFWCNGCSEVSGCLFVYPEDCITEHFENLVKEK